MEFLLTQNLFILVILAVIVLVEGTSLPEVLFK